MLRVGYDSVDLDWLLPDEPIAQVVLAHGAGAGLDHRNMVGIAQAFAAVGLATLRFNFPYMQAGKKRVDRQEVAVAAIAAAYHEAAGTHALPTFLAGHSYGGRMASHAVATLKLDCQGIIFCSFPLHPPKKPSVERAAHLAQIDKPMLFLSGTRDDLAEAALLQGVVDGLPNAKLHWLETANHSYVVLKRTRTNPTPIFTEMAEAAAYFVGGVLSAGQGSC